MNSKHQRITAFVLILVIAAFGATSVASAAPVGTAGTYSAVDESASLAAHTPAAVAQSSPANGFDWADALIGAGAALAICAIGVGVAMMLSDRSSRRGSPATT